jgi:ATP-dependent Clp protease ATP-binding subunit ClpA
VTGVRRVSSDLEETLGQILELQLAELRERLSKQKLMLSLSEAARILIVRKGYDPVNGARPLRRAIERLLTRPLSAQIVEDIFQPGDTIEAVTAEDDERLHFEKKAAVT